MTRGQFVYRYAYGDDWFAPTWSDPPDRQDHWSPDLAELPERIHGLRESTFATWELYVSMMDDWYRGVRELA